METPQEQIARKASVQMATGLADMEQNSRVQAAQEDLEWSAAGELLCVTPS